MASGQMLDAPIGWSMRTWMPLLTTEGKVSVEALDFGSFEKEATWFGK